MTPLWDRLFNRADNENLPEVVQRQKSLRKRFEPRRLIDDTGFVAFDSELTGLDFRSDSIISIGAVKLQGGRILPNQTFYRLVKPDSELKHESVVIHEITHSDLDHAEELQVVFEDFLEFIGDAVLIGHFVHIDINFVNRALKKLYNCTLNNPAVDTSTLHDWLYENDTGFARHHGGMTTRTDLFSLVKRYGVDVGKAHNAFSDAYMTAQLFQRFLPFLPACGIRTIKELLKVARP
jgi:DNA polymerase-3 subunit epsilon